MENAQQSMEMNTSHQIAGRDLYAWKQAAIAQARSAGIEPAEVDWLLRELLHLDLLSLRLLNGSTQLTTLISLDDLTHLWQRRLDERIPLQYLTGATPWRNFALKVSPAVLIPRPETELIVDLAAQLARAYGLQKPFRWADLGTGSGAIAIGLAQLWPEAEIHAVDVSSEALAIAQDNAQRLNRSAAMTFHQGHWWLPLESLKGQFQGMVSNPPYIPTGLIPSLQAEVARHEPHLALDGGEDGLEALRSLVQQSPDYLMPGGVWLVEIMVGQAQAVMHLLQADGRYDHIQAHQDWSGIERFISAQVIHTP
jgi:release factor glutamine methyltransferase